MGKLFIYSKKLFFHSALNNINLFSQTTVEIENSKIKGVQKDSTYIYIETDKETYRMDFSFS